MFTGIVAAACEVVATEQGDEVRSILVNLRGHDEDLSLIHISEPTRPY